ncbi:LysR family transcriptional regulator [Alphaproteobacteria bacterium LSUCC0684]
MKLKMRHLDVFDALFDAGSVSRAAERLNISQPAVSLALGNLEKELGFQLFHRDRGFFAPTSEALLLYDEVQKSMAALSRVEKRADEIRSGESGAIRIGTNGTLAFNFLPGIIAEFQQDYPDVYIEIIIQASRQISSWVASRQIDIGFIDTPVPVAGLEAEIHPLPCVCIMREDDALTHLDRIGPRDLKDRHIIAITGDHNVDRQLQKVMSIEGVELKYKVSCTYFALARRLVSSGNYLAIVDPINGSVPNTDGVVSRPFDPPIFHDLAMITSHDQKPDRVETRFKNIISARLDQHSNRKRKLTNKGEGG